jgi:hypothetical protein
LPIGAKVKSSTLSTIKKNISGEFKSVLYLVHILKETLKCFTWKKEKIYKRQTEVFSDLSKKKHVLGTKQLNFKPILNSVVNETFSFICLFMLTHICFSNVYLPEKHMQKNYWFTISWLCGWVLQKRKC